MWDDRLLAGFRMKSDRIIGIIEGGVAVVGARWIGVLLIDSLAVIRITSIGLHGSPAQIAMIGTSPEHEAAEPTHRSP